MDAETSSISGDFEARLRTEDARQNRYNANLFCQTSRRFFRSLKQVKLSLSGSLSSIVTTTAVETKRPRRPYSISLGTNINKVGTFHSLGIALDVFAWFCC